MERFERTITIPIKIENDEILREDGQPLPKLSNHAFGELVILSIFLEDVEDQIKYDQEEIKLVFKKGEELFFEMNPKFITNDKINDSNLIKIETKYFIKCLLEEDLFLKARYQKKAKFESCKCSIPCLNRTAESLNHAYTLISQEFEITRRSHTGNVFNICYFKNNDHHLTMLEIKRGELFNY